MRYRSRIDSKLHDNDAFSCSIALSDPLNGNCLICKHYSTDHLLHTSYLNPHYVFLPSSGYSQPIPEWRPHFHLLLFIFLLLLSLWLSSCPCSLTWPWPNGIDQRTYFLGMLMRVCPYPVPCVCLVDLLCFIVALSEYWGLQFSCEPRLMYSQVEYSKICSMKFTCCVNFSFCWPPKQLVTVNLWKRLAGWAYWWEVALQEERR